MTQRASPGQRQRTQYRRRRGWGGTQGWRCASPADWGPRPQSPGLSTARWSPRQPPGLRFDAAGIEGGGGWRARGGTGAPVTSRTAGPAAQPVCGEEPPRKSTRLRSPAALGRSVAEWELRGEGGADPSPSTSTPTHALEAGDGANARQSAGVPGTGRCEVRTEVKRGDAFWLVLRAEVDATEENSLVADPRKRGPAPWSGIVRARLQSGPRPSRCIASASAARAPIWGHPAANHTWIEEPRCGERDTVRVGAPEEEDEAVWRLDPGRGPCEAQPRASKERLAGDKKRHALHRTPRRHVVRVHLPLPCCGLAAAVRPCEGDSPPVHSWTVSRGHWSWSSSRYTFSAMGRAVD